MATFRGEHQLQGYIMAVDLYIHRKENWYDEAGEKISESEWLTYIKKNKKYQPSDRDKKLFVLREKTGGPWLFWIDNKINTQNPDHNFIKEMLFIAEDLNSKVQGDNDQFYVNTLYGFDQLTEIEPKRVEFHKNEIGGEIEYIGRIPEGLKQYTEPKTSQQHKVVTPVSTLTIILLLLLAAVGFLSVDWLVNNAP